MPTNPLVVHQQTLAQYLEWMQSGTGVLQPTIGGPESSNSLNPVPTFNWQGTDYACNYTWHRGFFYEAGGRRPIHQLIIEVLEPMADPGPAEDQLITFQGNPYRIQFIDLAAGKYPKLTCWDPNRGA